MKTEQEIKDAAFESSVDYKPWETDLEPEKYYEYGYVKGAKWMQEQDNWIDPNITPPEIGKKYAFVVDSPNDYYNGEVFGGKYQGNRYGYHEFSLPGISFAGILYQPLPNPPKSK